MARYRVTFDLDISYTRPALFKGKDSRDVDLMLLAVVDVPNKCLKKYKKMLQRNDFNAKLK